MSKYKEGDIVQIMPLTQAEKRRYPSTWVHEMDAYVGNITTIEKCIDSRYYKLKSAGGWTWHAMNLEQPATFEAFQKEKVGDKVEILSLTEEEKETYPPGWLNTMK